MYEEIKINYINPTLNLGIEDIRSIWLLGDKPVKLTASIHRGALVFRWPVSGKRVSYKRIKKGLRKRTIIIRQPIDILPF